MAGEENGSRPPETGMTRRGFLKRAALAGLGAVMGGALSPSKTETQPAVKTDENKKDEKLAILDPEKSGWETIRPLIVLTWSHFMKGNGTSKAFVVKVEPGQATEQAVVLNIDPEHLKRPFTHLKVEYIKAGDSPNSEIKTARYLSQDQAMSILTSQGNTNTLSLVLANQPIKGPREENYANLLIIPEMQQIPANTKVPDYNPTSIHVYGITKSSSLKQDEQGKFTVVEGPETKSFTVGSYDEINEKSPVILMTGKASK